MKFQNALRQRGQDNYITSVLYTNDNSISGKELRLKQEYFFSIVSTQNVIHEFSNRDLRMKGIEECCLKDLNELKFINK